MIGVPSSLFSGRGPRLSVLNRQATSSLLKLLALIWSSGEYLLPRWSAVYIGHSPFFVLGCPVLWPLRCGARVATPAASRTTAGTRRAAVRVIENSLESVSNGINRIIDTREATRGSGGQPPRTLESVRTGAVESAWMGQVGRV